MATISEMTFGVEFEVTFPVGTVQCGHYHQGTQVPELPQGWTAQHDGSLRCGPGRQTAEIVSPVLTGEDGILQVLAVIDWLNRHEATVNRSCGFHVHVGFDGSNSATLGRLVALVAQHEQALYASTGTKSREQGCFCQSVQRNQNFRQSQLDRTDRYHVLNVSNLFRGGKPTVEFRVFAGTLNPVKVTGHIASCLGLVEKALRTKRAAKWTPNEPVATSPVHRAGPGQTALTRLFYGLGWIHGREKHVHGNLSGDGIPTIKAIKKALMKLARKYDAE